MRHVAILGLLIGMGGCAAGESAGGFAFSEDVEFLRKHTDVVILKGDAPQAQVAVAPGYQGRVMTSTLAGEGGKSFGWINRKFILAGQTGTEFDNFGGEDRFWLGPEAGQFGLYFKPGAEQVPENWFTPPAFNDFQFDEVTTSDRQVRLTKHGMTVGNALGTEFRVDVDRVISVLSAADVKKAIGLAVPEGVKHVAYQSRNANTNAPPDTWKRDTGLLSIWILGQYAPAPKGIAIVPYVAGDEGRRGPVVNGDYFDPVPPERLRVTPETILFKTDGRRRGKIGVGPRRCRSAIGSYDAGNNVLTVVQYTFTRQSSYVNSLWGVPQKDPYAGDVVNSYNDGPLEPGGPPLHGGFFELETSSHADELQVHQSIEHVHRTMHFQGPPEVLQTIAAKALDADLDEIRREFGL